MEGQGTTNQGVWMQGVVPYVKLSFIFSATDRKWHDWCLLAIDKDVLCRYDTTDGVVECKPVSRDYEDLTDKLRMLEEEERMLRIQMEQIKPSRFRKKKDDDRTENPLEEKLLQVEQEIEETKRKIANAKEEAKRLAMRRFFDKIFDLILLPYLGAINVSEDEMQKVRTAWNSAVDFLFQLWQRGIGTTIPLSIPQGFLLLQLGFGATVELYTQLNYELLGNYFSLLKDALSKSQLPERCLQMTGEVMLSSDVLQKMLQLLISSAIPRRDP
jgi:regulator of replication initiation timing